MHFARRVCLNGRDINRIRSRPIRNHSVVPCVVNLSSRRRWTRYWKRRSIILLWGKLVQVMYPFDDDLVIEEFPRFKNERQCQFYQLVMDLVDPIILRDPYNLTAFCIKGQACKCIHPEEAIKALEMLLDVDKKAVENEEKLEALRQQEPDPYDSTYEEQIRQDEAYKALVSSKDFQVNQYGSGPCRLFPIKISLAEAYESVGKYRDAALIYDSLLHFIHSDKTNFYICHPQSKLLLFSGVSRCFLVAKDYSKTKSFCEMALAVNRQFPGNHLLLARSLWELGEKQKALKTLKQGILYETPNPDGDENRNIEHLERCWKNEFQYR